MEYKGFYLWAFEREPGRWRAAIRRKSGMPLTSGYKRFAKYTTDADATTAAGALNMAMAAIDTDFSRSKKGKSERFWRVTGTKTKQRTRDSA